MQTRHWNVELLELCSRCRVYGSMKLPDAPTSRLRVVCLVLGTLLIGTSVPCHARLHRAWTHRDLTNEADLIVIATATGTADTDDKLGAAGWQTQMVGVNTTFDVGATLKGKIDGKLVVHHFRYPDPTPPLRNGPSFVTFQTGERPPAYLLFLKKRDDGRYEPLAGQMDPTDSCFVLARAPDAIPQHAKPAAGK
jgi:hypothetical protein